MNQNEYVAKHAEAYFDLLHDDPDCTGHWAYPEEPCPNHYFAICLGCGAAHDGYSAMMAALREERRRLDLELLTLEGQKIFAESLETGDVVEANEAAFLALPPLSPLPAWRRSIVTGTHPLEVCSLDDSCERAFVAARFIRTSETLP